MYVLFFWKLILKIWDGKFIERKFWNIFLYKMYKMGKMYVGWNILIEIILKVLIIDDNKLVNIVKIINSFKFCFICFYDLLNISKLLVWDKSMIFILFVCMVIKNWGFVGFFFNLCIFFIGLFIELFLVIFFFYFSICRCRFYIFIYVFWKYFCEEYCV